MSALLPAALVALAVIGVGLAVAAFVGGGRREPEDACVPSGWSSVSVIGPGGTAVWTLLCGDPECWCDDVTNGGAGDAAPATAPRAPRRLQ